MGSDTLLTKAANCLVEEAQAKEHIAGSVAGAVGAPYIAGAVDRGVNRALARRRASDGGLWVGGRLVLTTSRLTFAPNAANRAVHQQLPEVTIELSAIRSVTVLPGRITKVIRVETDDRSIRLRCWGAASVAERVREAAPNLRADPA